jgi:hypothetical protein
MSRPTRNPWLRRLSAALAVLHVLVGTAALAQYRPPPLTEAQRLVQEGDAAQIAASAAITAGNKKEAEEKYRSALQLYEQALTTDPTLMPAAVGLGTAGTASWRSCSRW